MSATSQCQLDFDVITVLVWRKNLKSFNPYCSQLYFILFFTTFSLVFHQGYCMFI